MSIYQNKLLTEYYINKKIYFLEDELINYNINFKQILNNIPKSNTLYIYTSDVKTFAYQEIYINIKLYIEANWIYQNINKIKNY